MFCKLSCPAVCPSGPQFTAFSLLAKELSEVASAGLINYYNSARDLLRDFLEELKFTKDANETKALAG
jgi:hypothetical protein